MLFPNEENPSISKKSHKVSNTNEICSVILKQSKKHIYLFSMAAVLSFEGVEYILVFQPNYKQTQLVACGTTYII